MSFTIPSHSTFSTPLDFSWTESGITSGFVLTSRVFSRFEPTASELTSIVLEHSPSERSTSMSFPTQGLGGVPLAQRVEPRTGEHCILLPQHG